MKPRQLLIILLLFTATFGGGMVAGYALRTALAPPADPPRSYGMRHDGPMRDRLAERLNLTPEQHDRFFEILDTHRQKNRRRMATVRDSMEQVVRADYDSLATRLESILTPEQMEEWRRVSRRRR